MISLRSSNWRNTSAKAAAALLLIQLSACSLFSSPTGSAGSAEQGQASSPTRKRTRSRALLSQFEWAVQSYEAGDYLRAVRQFRELRKAGASLEDFELVPFYLGMSYFQLGKNTEAAASLERFIQSGSGRHEAQDARMALLLIYERQANWSKLLGLAAEADHQTLFQNNRALLKLLWARALIETGEYLGAKSQLKDATQYLDFAAGRDRSVLAESERDIWGRYHYTSLLVREHECDMHPKAVGSSKKPKYLYGNWLEGNIDCVQQTLNDAVNELMLRESPWSGAAAAVLQREIDSLASKITAAMTREQKSLNARSALEKVARRQLYRIMTELEKSIKIFKEREVSPQPLEQLRKRIDLLIVSLSRPS
jgi:hypothetical protein